MQYGKRQIIKAYHKYGGRLYAWELPDNMAGQISEGCEVFVFTQYGRKRVIVVSVDDYGGAECARPLKMVIRKINSAIQSVE